MRKIVIILFLLSFFKFSYSQEYPIEVQKLIKAYPNFEMSYQNNFLILKDNTYLKYKDCNNNSDNQPCITEIFKYPYPKGKVNPPQQGEDPGRIRNEELMKSMYGHNSVEVQRNLVSITWCPNLVGSKIKITKINNVHLQLQKVSDELDKHPELKQYLLNASTFNWRIISGTNRLSTHSFGTAIDLNVKYSNYWQWDCRCKNESTDLKYKNQIPQMIVEIFEKYGFIWGGKWYHYDTMHFEYRPELLID